MRPLSRFSGFTIFNLESVHLFILLAKGLPVFGSSVTHTIGCGVQANVNIGFVSPMSIS